MRDYILKINENLLRDSLIKSLKNHGEFLKAPALKFWHHDYKYGLLEHSVETLQNAFIIKNLYPNTNINDDILISGAVTHDIGINYHRFSSTT